MNFKHGFIGPLGDDIPSIFPIIVGIVLFTGAMMFAANMVDQRNEFLDVRRATVALAYSATEKGYYDAGTFIEKCGVLETQAKANRVFFVWIIKNYCNTQIDFQALANDPTGGTLLDAEKPSAGLKCWIGGLRTPAGVQATEPESGVMQLPKDSVVFNYPIAVDCADQTHRGLGLMSLVVWRQFAGATVTPPRGP